MFPHERSLVKQLTDQPFAMIGVNTDVSQDYALRQNVKQKITWRSFWDGNDGPISAQWNMREKGFPDTWLLDPKGTIRYEFVGMGPSLDGTLDEAIELLLAEAGATVNIEHTDDEEEIEVKETGDEDKSEDK